MPPQFKKRWRLPIAGGCCARRLVWASLFLMFVCGCGFEQWMYNGLLLGPNYPGPPPAPVATSWIDSNESGVIPYPPTHADWWSVFNDPVLNNLIQTAHSQNLTLREAGWRVMQARARLAIATGNFFPQTQQGFGEFDRIWQSKSGAAVPPVTSFDQWATGLNLAWEIDVWGRFRRSIISADADVGAAVGDYDAILLCLLAEVATAYADYRTFQQRLAYAERNVEIQEQSLKLAQEKADAGKTGYTSVHLAESSLESTRASIPSFEIGIRQASNRLCTLLGIPMRDLSKLLGTGDIPKTPQQVAIGIPADLLRRRPDIRAAERAIASQSEQIGIAISDLYPHFSITGEIALQSEKFSDLFSSASSFGSIGPSFRWNLLNYGRIVNNVYLQGFGLEELITGYQNTVLTANQEVEDALVAFLENQQRVQHLEKAVAETQEALRLLTISFEEGDISFTGVFVLQGELATRQDQLAESRGDVIASLISLYKALGGGWEIRYPQCPPSGLVTFESQVQVIPFVPQSEGEPMPPKRRPTMSQTQDSTILRAE